MTGAICELEFEIPSSISIGYNQRCNASTEYFLKDGDTERFSLSESELIIRFEQVLNKYDGKRPTIEINVPQPLKQRLEELI
ncbi:MAG: hypothetical protein ABIJ18_01175 [archaeon]